MPHLGILKSITEYTCDASLAQLAIGGCDLVEMNYRALTIGVSTPAKVGSLDFKCYQLIHRDLRSRHLLQSTL